MFDAMANLFLALTEALSDVLSVCTTITDAVLAVINFAWSTILVLLHAAHFMCSGLVAAAIVLKESLYDVYLLISGIAKLAVYVAAAAAGGAEALGRLIERAVGVSYDATVTAYEYASHCVGIPRMALDEAAGAAVDLDIRAFESTRWFFAKIGELAFALAGWLLGIVVTWVIFILCLPNSILLWVASAIELASASTVGLIRGLCLALASSIEDLVVSLFSGLSSLGSALAGLPVASHSVLSRLSAIAAVAVLVAAMVAKCYWSEGDHPDNATEDEELSREHTFDEHRGREESTAMPRATDETQSQESTSRHASCAGAQASGSGDRSSSSSFSDSEKQIRDLQKQLEAERDKQICVVCQHDTKSVLIQPCRHLCLCATCARHIMTLPRARDRACPLCRTYINYLQEVYS